MNLPGIRSQESIVDEDGFIVELDTNGSSFHPRKVTINGTAYVAENVPRVTATTASSLLADPAKFNDWLRTGEFNTSEPVASVSGVPVVSHSLLWPVMVPKAEADLLREEVDQLRETKTQLEAKLLEKDNHLEETIKRLEQQDFIVKREYAISLSMAKRIKQLTKQGSPTKIKRLKGERDEARQTETLLRLMLEELLTFGTITLPNPDDTDAIPN